MKTISRRPSGVTVAQTFLSVPTKLSLGLRHRQECLCHQVSPLQTVVRIDSSPARLELAESKRERRAESGCLSKTSVDPRPSPLACTAPPLAAGASGAGFYCVMRLAIVVVAMFTFGAQNAFAQTTRTSESTRTSNQNSAQAAQMMNLPSIEEWLGPTRLTNTMLVFLIMTVLTLVPSIVIMTTSFVRIVIVLSITRQALGTQSLPPNTVLTTIAIFMTFHVMQPTLSKIYDEAIVPYSAGKIDANQLVDGVVRPMRDFMAQQIEITNNHDSIWLFVDFSPHLDPQKIQTYDDVPLNILLPAFLLSEIRTAFLIGFQLFLPFLIIDMAISSILVSMGMMMLPPVLISLPFKLLLFVLVDGWRLIAETLLVSFFPLEPPPLPPSVP